VDRLTGLLVPEHDGFTLVGDPDASNVRRSKAGLRRELLVGLPQDSNLGVEDFDRILLDPTGLRIGLGNRSLALGTDLAIGIKSEGTTAGRALVKCD
jgi:hypothetical protein